MPDVTPVDSGTTPEAYRSVQGLVHEVQGIITDVYGLEDISDASEMVWDGTDTELETLLKKDLPSGSIVYDHNFEDGARGSIIYHHTDRMQRLAQSTVESRLRGNCLKDMLALIEETSHYIYIEFHARKFNNESPHSANTEMIGVIDKYNILQALFIKNFGRSMDSVEQAQSVYHNAIASEEKDWSGDRPANYIIGHDLGKQYVYYLNGLYIQGVDPTEELQTFYGMSNKQQMEHLFYDLDLRVETRTPTEEVAVQTTLQQIGVNSAPGNNTVRTS